MALVPAAMISEFERVFAMLDPIRDGLAAGYQLHDLMSGAKYQEMISCTRHPDLLSSPANLFLIHEWLVKYYCDSARLLFTTVAWRKWTFMLSQLFIFQEITRAKGARLAAMAAKVRRDALVERAEPALARVLVRSAFRDFYFRCARQTYGPSGRGRARDIDAYEQVRIG